MYFLATSSHREGRDREEQRQSGFYRITTGRCFGFPLLPLSLSPSLSLADAFWSRDNSHTRIRAYQDKRCVNHNNAEREMETKEDFV
jgi:hypothetical protein